MSYYNNDEPPYDPGAFEGQQGLGLDDGDVEEDDVEKAATQLADARVTVIESSGDDEDDSEIEDELREHLIQQRAFVAKDIVSYQVAAKFLHLPNETREALAIEVFQGVLDSYSLRAVRALEYLGHHWLTANISAYVFLALNAAVTRYYEGKTTSLALSANARSIQNRRYLDALTQFLKEKFPDGIEELEEIERQARE